MCLGRELDEAKSPRGETPGRFVGESLIGIDCMYWLEGSQS